MADINQVITLGIGTPAGIPEFLTFGLQIGAASALYTVDGNVAIRMTGDGNVAVRMTGDGNAAIRTTADENIEVQL
jgi:hypothetical protein